MPKVPVTCQECGNGFTVKESEIKNGRGKYCSRECANKAKSQLFGESHPNYKGRIIKKCEVCGKELKLKPYEAKNGSRKYCSVECSIKAHVGENHYNWKPKIKQICQECGQEFLVYERILKKGRGKFCSQTCKGKWQSKNAIGENAYNYKAKVIIKKCEECGKEFPIYESKTKHGWGKYCSKLCSYRAKSRLYSGENSPEWVDKIIRKCRRCGKEILITPSVAKQNKGYYCSKDCYNKDIESKFQKISKKCKFCGKEILTQPSKQRQEGSNYCSHECYGKDRTNRFSGENCPAWRGGISFEPYCPKFNNQLKERVRKWFDYTCVECGEPQGKRKLTVHHVYYNKGACCEQNENGEYIQIIDDEQVKVIGNPNKFVALCTGCHTKTTRKNRIYWARHFEEIINTWYQGRSWTD